MQENKINQETLELEASTALSRMRSSQDLDERAGILRDRATVDDGKLAAFIVTVPEDYDDADRAVFIKFINDSLEKAAKDAESQVEYDRMWKR